MICIRLPAKSVPVRVDVALSVLVANVDEAIDASTAASPPPKQVPPMHS